MSILRIALSAILLVGLTGAVPLLKSDESLATLAALADDIDYRLPGNVKPSLYTIKLKPNLVEGAFTFSGESAIKITVTKPTGTIKETKIVIHAKDLEIDAASVTLVDAKDVILKPSATPTINLTTDFYTMTFDGVLDGVYTLNLKYTGVLHDDLNGFYRSSYVNAQGETVWLATTQFEPTWARRAFPCFDEPALKAAFDISINHFDNYKAVSNMPIKNIEPDETHPAKQWTNFKTTPVMSTYLIAFVVSTFDSKLNKAGDFRVWSQPSILHKAKYALEVGEKELKELTKYMGIAHSETIKKMDNFAIPHFRAGAMENWGIVTYRENYLLYEENVTSTDAKQGIATVISHEFAHQWFGNRVSPAWWDYTWLNEGFANYFQYFITDKVETTWRLMDQFVTKNLQEQAFKADDKEDQHPMNGAVKSPQQISAFFDTITYSKAGCVIRMFSHALTEKVFQKGLQTYLKNKGHTAATSDDLFTNLIGAVPADPKPEVTKAHLESWAKQRGYPVVTVVRNYDAGTAELSQHRFLTKKPTKKPEEAWYIPINYADAKAAFADTKPKLWLPNVLAKNTTVKSLGKGWLILNNQQTGYYRVNYDAKNWQLIINHLKSTNYTDVHVLNRAQLLDDSFNLALAGELDDFSLFLDMTTYLKQEVDYVPWNAAFRAFGVLNKALSNTGRHTLFKLYIQRIIENLEKKVGYTESDEDDHVTKFNRINAINWACHAGSKSCVAAALKQLEEHIAGTTKLSADLRSVVLCAGVRAADANTWNKTFELYESSKDDTQRAEIMAALGCSTDSKVLKELLQSSIVEKSKITPTNALKVVVAGSASGTDIAFEFINEKFDKIVEIANGTTTVVQLLNEIASRMNTQAQLDKLKKFIEAHPKLPDSLKTSSVASVTQNIAWLKTNEPNIGKFLDAQKLVDPPVTPKPKDDDDNSSGVALPALQLILGGLAASFVARFH